MYNLIYRIEMWLGPKKDTRILIVGTADFI